MTQTTLTEVIGKTVRERGSVLFRKTNDTLPYTVKVNLQGQSGSTCVDAMQRATEQTVIAPASAAGVERLLEGYGVLAFVENPDSTISLGCGNGTHGGWVRDYKGSEVAALVAAARWGQKKDAVRSYVSNLLAKVRASLYH